MANAAVKSSQEMGSFVFRVVSSRRSTRKVMQKQKHQLNMHQAQKEPEAWPIDATRLKEMQVKTTASILTMPTGAVSVLKSTVTMLTISRWTDYSWIYC